MFNIGVIMVPRTSTIEKTPKILKYKWSELLIIPHINNVNIIETIPIHAKVPNKMYAIIVFLGSINNKRHA